MGVKTYAKLGQQDNQDMGVAENPSWERGSYLREVLLQVVCLLAIIQCPPCPPGHQDAAYHIPKSSGMCQVPHW